MFTGCESGRELMSDAGTACQQTENQAVKPHAVYVAFKRKKETGRGTKTVLKGSDGVVKIWSNYAYFIYPHHHGVLFDFICQEIENNPNDHKI